MANINEVLFSLLHGVFQSVTAFVVIAFAFEYCRNVLEIFRILVKKFGNFENGYDCCTRKDVAKVRTISLH